MAAAFLVAILLLVAEGVWICGAGWCHNFRPTLAFTSVGMGFVYRVFTVQLLFFLANGSRDDNATLVLTIVSALMPVLLFVVGLGITSGFEGALGRYWPFVMPFRYLADDAIGHTLALLVLGSSLMLIAGGRALQSPFHEGVSNA